MLFSAVFKERDMGSIAVLAGVAHHIADHAASALGCLSPTSPCRLPNPARRSAATQTTPVSQPSDDTVRIDGMPSTSQRL